MNRILVILLVCLSGNISCTQNQTSRIFNSEIGHFSFAYPAYLESQIISNAPHTLLKLDSEKYALSLALWESNLERSISIWDEELIAYYQDIEKNTPNIQIEKSCEKIYLKITDNLKVKFLKSITNTENTYLGQTIKCKQITYRLLHKGNYLQFIFFIFDYHDYWNNSQFTDEIMKGLNIF